MIGYLTLTRFMKKTGYLENWLKGGDSRFSLIKGEEIVRKGVTSRKVGEKMQTKIFYSHIDRVFFYSNSNFLMGVTKIKRL